MKSSCSTPNRSRRGAALIVAAALLFSALVFLTAALWMAQSRRERVHKTLIRDLAESEARALSLQYRAHLAAQFRGLASVNTNSWSPPTSVTTLAAPPAPGSALFSRSLPLPALTITVAAPNQNPSSSTAIPGHPLCGAFVHPIASASTAWNWTPSGWSSALPRRISTPWQLEQSWSFEEVPLSIFHYYSSALEDTPAPSQSHVGRAHFEKNARIIAPMIVSGTLIPTGTLNGTPPITVGGTLNVLPGGALILGTGRAFAPAQNALSPDKAAAEYRSRFPEEIFEADANPIILCRPIGTDSLFSPSDAGLNPNQKIQQLKPACDVIVSYDPTLTPPFTITGSAIPGVSAALIPFFTFDTVQNVVELDMGSFGSWPVGIRSVWFEAAPPVPPVAAVVALRIKNANTLPGPFSLATPLDIRVQGSFNDAGGEKPASLLTFGSVIAEP